MIRFARTRRAGRWVLRHSSLVAYLLIGAVGAVGVWQIDVQSDQRATERCIDNRDNRAVIRELVEVATAPASAGGGDLSALTEIPEFRALDAEERAYWVKFFEIISSPSSPSDGGEPPSSVNERLVEFAREKLTPIDCG